jgi:hypothetical protein
MANMIQLIANIPFLRAKTAICHTHISSGTLIIITSRKIKLQLVYMQTHTKHPRLIDTNRRVQFVIPVLWICNNKMCLRKALLLSNFGCLPLLFYERILNYIHFVASLLALSILRFLMIRIAKFHSNTKEILIQFDVYFVLLWVCLCQLLLKCCLPCVSLLNDKIINKSVLWYK